jgi:hypothetical protein
MAKEADLDHSSVSPSISIYFDFVHGTVTTLDFIGNLGLVGKPKSGHLAHQENLSTIAHSKKEKIGIFEAAPDSGGATHSQKA